MQQLGLGKVLALQDQKPGFSPRLAANCHRFGQETRFLTRSGFSPPGQDTGFLPEIGC